MNLEVLVSFKSIDSLLEEKEGQKDIYTKLL